MSTTPKTPTALDEAAGYASLKDTPNRYVYREIWGMSAKMALGFISSLRKTYPQLSEELDAEQRFFEDALLKHNNSDQQRRAPGNQQ